jgi:signal transduction histidine kinase
MRLDRLEWPHRQRWIDLAWALFAVANLVAMYALPRWETIPFHFIWVSLTLLYGFRVWDARATSMLLALVMISTGCLIGLDISKGNQPLDELAEVPLMATMFLVMVWHARRRVSAMQELEKVSGENLRLLERERRFVQDASHELRTPITVALGHAELIQRQASTQKVSEDAAVIADELGHLRRLADRLLLLAAIEDPEFLHLVPVNTEAIVVDAVRRWAAAPRRWLLGDTDEATVLADADRLAVALDSLIENAVKHTREQDSIEVSSKVVGAAVVIGVSDTGTGIPEKDLAHVFDRFARADPGRSRHTGGFGLGLSIVRAIADAHGGTVHVKSTQGGGSRFQITLPAMAAGPGARPRGGDSAEWAQRGGSVTAGPSELERAGIEFES